MKFASQQGQTLIETMVALVVLTVGVTAALALANYALSASTNITKQIVGMGLAREGIEAIKNMRDTNWLKDTLNPTCYDYRTDDLTASCYPNWLQVVGGYTIRGSAEGKSFVLEYNSLTTPFWQLVPQTAQFGLSYDGTGVNGLYSVRPGNASGYFRKIIITEITTPPFIHLDLGPELLVTSQVWWKDKNCPEPSPDEFPTTGSCRIQLEMKMTNWKNY